MLFQQITANKRKSIVIVIGFVLFTMMVFSLTTFYFFNDFLSGLLVGGVFLAVYIPYTLVTGKKRILKLNHAKQIKKASQAPHLFHTVEGLSIVARIPVPEIYIIEDNSPNAFATGFSPENAAVTVTSGLLKKLNREEIEAVVAHEIAHIKNYDIRLLTLSITLLSIITIITDIATSFISGNNRNPATTVLTIVALILSPLVATAIHFSLSRNREFLADATGAELCRNPRALASALYKISKDSTKMDVPKSSANMYIADPFKKHFTNIDQTLLGDEELREENKSLFSTHPSTTERIKRLLAM